MLEDPNTINRPQTQLPAPSAERAEQLPFIVLGGIVLCYLLHFGYVATTQPRTFAARSASRAALAANTLTAANGESFTLEICNHSAEPKVYVAVAYFDSRLKDYVARGWFPQQRGACQKVLAGLTGDVYVWAENRSAAAIREIDPDFAHAESASMNFCISGQDAFVLPQQACNQLSQASASTQIRQVEFQRLNHLPTIPKNVVTWTIKGSEVAP